MDNSATSVSRPCAPSILSDERSSVEDCTHLSCMHTPSDKLNPLGPIGAPHGVSHEIPHGGPLSLGVSPGEVEWKCPVPAWKPQPASVSPRFEGAPSTNPGGPASISGPLLRGGPHHPSCAICGRPASHRLRRLVGSDEVLKGIGPSFFKDPSDSSLTVGEQTGVAGGVFVLLWSCLSAFLSV